VPQQLQLLSDLSLSDEEVTQLLDRLDANGSGVANELRGAPRHPLRGRAVCVILVHPNATNAMRVRLRNLSSTGIAFLSATFLAPGTSVQLLMPQTVGDKVGVVRRSRIVQPDVFEVGAVFAS